MQPSTLTILGCGSALPTRTSFPSAQLINIRERQFLIDCGEGTQIRMRQMGVKNTRLGHIFISHLHGDHCFGLIGMISSFGMLNRTADLYIHAQPELEKTLQPQLDYFCAGMPFRIIFEPFDPTTNSVIYEDRAVTISTIPLKHRVPTAGFFIEEKQRDRHILRDMIDFYQVPTWQIQRIKQGEDFVTGEGEVIPNKALTSPAEAPKKFAYCSDTMYSEKIIPVIEGADLLYHEATFMETEKKRAMETGHSTATQAATIALKANVKKLVIGHISARYSQPQTVLNESKKIFENTVLGEDMKRYEF